MSNLEREELQDFKQLIFFVALLVLTALVSGTLVNSCTEQSNRMKIDYVLSRRDNTTETLTQSMLQIREGLNPETIDKTMKISK